MPNKNWDMSVDIIPNTTNTFNLGNETKKWVVNGYNLGDACAKGVDSSISSGSTSQNVPTSQAVATLVGSIENSISVSGTTLYINATPPSNGNAEQES